MLSKNDFSSKQIIFLVPKDGDKLVFRNDNIIVVDRNGEVKHQSTCYRLFAVFIVGHITITSGLIQRAKKFGFSIIFMTTSFRPYQTISSFAQANVMLRKNQYEYSEINAAISLIENKILNQIAVINQLRNKSEMQKEAISNLKDLYNKVKCCSNIQMIMGVEGTASRVYFKNYFNNVIWNGRKPRIKHDMINSLLDIGYTILFSYVGAIASVFGFDSYCGFLHTQFYMRQSLICDLVEPFRPIIDKCVRKSINLGIFKTEDFMVYNEQWQLKYEKTAEYSSVFINAIFQYRDEIYVYIRDVYRCYMNKTLNTNFPVWRMEDGYSKL